MIIIERKICIIPQVLDDPNQNRTIDSFRNKGAWVLLGEPGSGKTTLMQSEAERTGSIYLRVEEFVDSDIEIEWQNKTLYLDGLDEARGSYGKNNPIQAICKQLKRLEKPRFRLACRIADWYGSSDLNDLKKCSPDGDITQLQLRPLTNENIIYLLEKEHNLTESKTYDFIDKTVTIGLYTLLENPLTLNLMARAIKNDEWPKTRTDVFNFACNNLVSEENRKHRDKNRQEPFSNEQLLQMASQLCAILYLAGKTGFALDQSQSNEHFTSINDCNIDNGKLAEAAIDTRLFLLDASNNQLVIPIHRNIAEYLGARWIASQLKDGLPLNRILNLLLTSDHTIASNLRGVAAWLAAFSEPARTQLIDADPSAMIAYGDVELFDINSKKQILTKLRGEAESFPGFFWEIEANYHFGALADIEMIPEFTDILKCADRDDATQALVRCVLLILSHWKPIDELVEVILSVVKEVSRWPLIRQDALVVWLKLTQENSPKLNLLDEIKKGILQDGDYELTGILLSALYPSDITAEKLFDYFYPENFPVIIGGKYSQFWFYELYTKAPNEHLPIILDKLLHDSRLFFKSDSQDGSPKRLVGELLSRSIECHGDTINDEQLFGWLGLSLDLDGLARVDESTRKKISGWLSKRPERYKSLLLLCYKQYDKDNKLFLLNQRLLDAKVPDDIGLWHLQQVTIESHSDIANEHLKNAVNALYNHQGNKGLSVDLLMSWRDQHPTWLGELNELFVCNEPSRIDMALRKASRKAMQLTDKEERSKRLTPLIPLIREGTAPVNVMHELARLWKNYNSSTIGITPDERFNNYCENGLELFEAAKSGFIRCPERYDLPTIDEIILLANEDKEYLVSLPCLIGMELRWKQGVKWIECLSVDMLKRMVAFCLTCGYEKIQEWFFHLLETHPDMMAQAILPYINSSLKAKKDVIEATYGLAYDKRYEGTAKIIVIEILKKFPGSVKKRQLIYLNHLLKSALRYRPDDLKLLLSNKIKIKSMPATQKVYWYATAMMLDQAEHEAGFWSFIDKSQPRIFELARFFSDNFDVLTIEDKLSASLISNLIEVLTPYADLDSFGNDLITQQNQIGTLIRALIKRLGNSHDEQAGFVIEHLMQSDIFIKLKYYLEVARRDQKILQREKDFQYPTVKEVAGILANKAPANIGDLNALALNMIDLYSYGLKTENTDVYKMFWNINHKGVIGPRSENLCRDQLLLHLKQRLEPFGVEVQPEADCANDKRADIRVSFQNKFELPIEIKRQSNANLWTGLNDQLIKQYNISKKSSGYGIYLVLWFGSKNLPIAIDGQKKPLSPQELQKRLEVEVERLNEPRVSIRVLDLSWVDTKAL